MTETIPYEVGKFYRVPVIVGRWRDADGEWPVLGPLHEDAEYIGFEPLHWHVDARFLTQRQWRTATFSKDRGLGVEDVFNMPVQKTYEDWQHKPMVLIVNPAPILKLRKCRRVWPTYPGRVRWRKKLEAAYADCELRPGMVCPHRGAPLEGLEVHDGCVTCPLHGLRWNVTTGRLAPVVN